MEKILGPGMRRKGSKGAGWVGHVASGVVLERAKEEFDARRCSRNL